MLQDISRVCWITCLSVQLYATEIQPKSPETYFAPFVGKEPHTIVEDNGLSFNTNEFVAFSLDFLNHWDKNPNEIRALHFSTAIHGLHGITSLLDRVPQKKTQALVDALQGKNFRKRLHVLVEWIEEEKAVATELYLNLLGSKEWDQNEHNFFSLTQEILFGSAWVQHLPATLHFDTTSTYVTLMQEKLKKIDEEIRQFFTLLLKKQSILFPHRIEQLTREMTSPTSPYYGRNGIFQEILTELSYSTFEEIPLIED